jgi:hypothetical protein
MRFAILAGAEMRRLSPQNVGGDVSIVNKDIYNARKALFDDFEMLKRCRHPKFNNLLEGIVILLARSSIIIRFKASIFL